MSIFDSRAREWDKDKMHMQRSMAIKTELGKMIPIKRSWKALEFGAGTGILSFLLKDWFSEITLMDNSSEMIKVCKEKIEYHKIKNFRPIWFDLEKMTFDGKFDIIYNQMVLHHVSDIEAIILTFCSLLNPEGYLAIADLYTEDGSFHGPEVKVHWGFDTDRLANILKNAGFRNVKHKSCFEIKRESGKKYPVFLMIAQK